jgi:succinylglutamate desuccinylase
MAEGFERDIGRVRGAAPGPMLIVVAGIHGNEPAGVRAAARALEQLGSVRLAGDVVALAGNVRALRLGRRYQTRDLNRMWTGDPASGDDPEALERRELGAALDAALAAARGPACFLDLHTTSAAGVPFAMIFDTPAHRAFARAFPLPILLGLEGHIAGVITGYMNGRGCMTLACEGGQHDDPASERSLEALLWIAVAAAGLAPPAELPAWPFAWLDRTRGDLPRLIEVVARQPAADGFVMEPGFANIARVRAGQLLARDRRGPIHAPADGLVLLPLYQAQGHDGFFLGREVGAEEHEASRG